MAEQLDLLTSSAVVSPARTSAPPALAQDSPAPDPGCGSKCSESCEKCGPVGFLLRTFLRCEVEALTSCSVAWKRAATPAGRSWWVLTTRAQPIAANASGSSGSDWPTPTATPYGTSNNGCPGDGREEFATKGKPSLETMAAMVWPTPTARLGDTDTGRTMPSASTAQARIDQGKRNLDDAVAINWPTPLAADHRGSAGVGKKELPNAVKQWPTPRAEDCEQTGAHRGEPDTLTSAARVWSTPHGMGELDDPHGSELSQQVRVAAGLSDSERSARKIGMWPTATAGDAKASGSRNTENSAAHPGISLTDAAVHELKTNDRAARREWLTPTGRDWKDSPGQMSCVDTHEHCDLLPRQVFAGLRDQDSTSTPGNATEQSRMLNANWVFQLMGYPATWARLSTVRDSRLRETLSSL